MTQANQADLFGEGVYGSQQQNDPNNLPNPNNPGGISNNQLALLQNRQRAHRATSQRQSTVQGNANATADERRARIAEQARQERITSQGPAGQAGNDWLYPGIVAGTIGAGILGAGLVGAAGGTAAGSAALASPYAAGGAYAAPYAGAYGVGTATAATAAPTLGAVGTVASPFPAAAAAGPAMYSAPAAAAGGSALRDVARYGLGGAGLAGLTAEQLGLINGGSSGGGGGAAGAPAAAGAQTNYAPSGGYLRPTVTQPGAAQGGSGLSPEAQRTLAAANQFELAGQIQPTGQRAQPRANPAAQSMMPTNVGNFAANAAPQQPSGTQQVQNLSNQFAQQNSAASASYNQQAAAAGNRAAPQINAPSSANQMSVYNAAGSFQPNTSGVAGIRAATADVSGAGRLEGFQSTESAQGVNALYAYNPDATYLSANQLGNFQAENTAEGANAVAGFRPDQVQADAQSLRDFRADQTGINRLNAYADEAQGPSAAQAMLRGQADADKRTMLAIARSGRGGPGASVNAQRQALTEGGLIAAETRGQAATLAAQETDLYKQRQLSALAQAGSLISQSEAQRLTGLSNAGALMSAADQQKLSALQAYGQLKATQDSQQLSARQSAGQLNLGADQARLGATTAAAQVQSAMDAQRLSAQTSAANIRLQGSEINQRGQIAATQAELQGSAQQLQAMGLQASIASDVRNQDITVLRANLDSSLQTMNLNDTQTRYFAGLGAQRDIASQGIQMQAAQFGVSAEQAQQSLNLQYQQSVYSQLSQQQQLEYNYNALNANTSLGLGSQAISLAGQQQQQNQFDVAQANQQSNATRNFYGGLLLGAANL